MLVQSDPQSVLFSFGGIGATPDDFTRKCAANVFKDGKMERNQGALQAILDQFGDEAYPHRVHMADLPINAKLLYNPVSNVPGFYLDNRFFFVPGFPQMAQAMILEALELHYPKNNTQIFRLTLTAHTSENFFIDIMKTMDKNVDFSSLPIMEDDKRYTVLSVASNDKHLTSGEFDKFINHCKAHNIGYSLEDIKQNK
jgi:molybdopterin-biosynthesis enzyme MoeA-like protein